MLLYFLDYKRIYSTLQDNHEPDLTIAKQSKSVVLTGHPQIWTGRKKAEFLSLIVCQ